MDPADTRSADFFLTDRYDNLHNSLTKLFRILSQVECECASGCTFTFRISRHSNQAVNFGVEFFLEGDDDALEVA